MLFLLRTKKKSRQYTSQTACVVILHCHVDVEGPEGERLENAKRRMGVTNANKQSDLRRCIPRQSNSASLSTSTTAQLRFRSLPISHRPYHAPPCLVSPLQAPLIFPPPLNMRTIDKSRKITHKASQRVPKMPSTRPSTGNLRKR